MIFFLFIVLPIQVLNSNSNTKNKNNITEPFFAIEPVLVMLTEFNFDEINSAKKIYALKISVCEHFCP